ncbi:hypothetical protein HG535_0E04010 [Zygotorulaspora mrakii]|uniref:J domain-containing protein n=1 Tax=Zygotorulaspora mrakii TaxID=42260 RepID=A0A7H9B457_ZYGMR|nr:uncharacterized protein HG535_0E04010 [Zygotorulaspora mrakii]QLG73317.1 hypothetical protein HG535_0E04010 [Zygotorulaspora mrakii]
MLRTAVQRRSISTFYELFPRTFPKGTPQWNIEQSKLRKEYRALQAQYHPDMLSATFGKSSDHDGGDQSSLLNKAYHTLKDPLLRSQHILKAVQGTDLSQERIAQDIMQSNPDLLIQVLDTHEQLEEVQNIEDVHVIERENKQRITSIEHQLEQCFNDKDFAKASKLTVELKYWVNLAKAIKEWEPGKPVTLSH